MEMCSNRAVPYRDGLAKAAKAPLGGGVGATSWPVSAPHTDTLLRHHAETEFDEKWSWRNKGDLLDAIVHI